MSQTDRTTRTWEKVSDTFLLPRGFVVLLLFALLLLGGCRISRASVTPYLLRGDYAAARDVVERQVVDDRSSRRYMLDRMRAGVLNLDAGDAVRSEAWFAEVYDVLRTQGLNADKTVQSIVLTEGVKVWKGEPFEQALALTYYGFVQARLGSWDNARAAAGNALFYLRDFDADREREDRLIDTEEVARRAIEYERRHNEGGGNAPSGDEYLNNGYVVERSNYTMAYLLHAIASQQLDRPDEASDYYNRVLQLEPGLRPVVQRLRNGDYNTVLVIAAGIGPRKVATGPDGAIAAFRPSTFSSIGPVRVSEPGVGAVMIPPVTNVNTMARDHRWNNLEDIRLAKSRLGDLAVTGGAAALLIGADNSSEAAMIAGGAAILAGLFLKATARANTDYADVFPQRLYLVPLTITRPDQPVSIKVPAYNGDHTLVIDRWDVPLGPDAALRYVRLPRAVTPIDVPSRPARQIVPGPGQPEPDPPRRRLLPLFR
ncbi:MAG: hypothetical protein AAGH88_00225 [Planctomycetota bacterium]